MLEKNWGESESNCIGLAVSIEGHSPDAKKKFRVDHFKASKEQNKY